MSGSVAYLDGMNTGFADNIRAGAGGGGEYSSMLKSAQGQYQGILKGYQQALRGQQRAQQRNMQGYNQLSSNVLGGLAGAGTARSTEIADQYTQAAGMANQQLINRGLGNTTVASSVGARYTLDQSKAQNDLANQLANTTAGYQSQIGLAGLGYRGQAIGQRTALQGQQLGYMGDYQGRLGGWAMQGAGMGQSRGGGGGGGGGIRGGGGGGGESAADREHAKNYYGGTGLYDNSPMVDLNQFSGMGGGGGGGRPAANPWQYASASEYGNETPGYTYDWA